MANVSYRLEDLKKAIVGIGYVGENDHMHVLIDCKEVFDEYPEAVPTMAIVPPVGEGYPKAVTRNGNVVEWLVKDSDVTAEGDGEFQLTFTEGEVIKKSVNGRFRVVRSISGSGNAPSGVQDWLTDANEKLAAVEQATQEAEDAAEHQPKINASGYWEIWDAETGAYVATTVKAQGDKGDPGDPGSPGDPTQLIDDTASEGVTDKTLSADKLHTEFEDVKNDIQEQADTVIGLADAEKKINGIKPIRFTKNKYIDVTSSPVDITDLHNSSIGYMCAVVECSQGDLFTISGTTRNYPRLWTFINSNRNIITQSEGNLDANNIIIQAPANSAYVIIQKTNNADCYEGVFGFNNFKFHDDCEPGSVNGTITNGINLNTSNFTRHRSQNLYKVIGNGVEIVLEFDSSDVSNITKIQLIRYKVDFSELKLLEVTSFDSKNRAYFDADNLFPYFKVLVYHSNDIYSFYGVDIYSYGTIIKVYHPNIQYSTYKSIPFNYVMYGNEMASGRLLLPQNYKMIGKKVPLIVYVHGSGGITEWTSPMYDGEEREKCFKYLNDEGFAVFDCYPWSHNLSISPYAYNPFQIPMNIRAYIEGVKYVCSRFNVDINNVALLCKSQGGNIGHWATVETEFPFRAVGLFAPTTDPVLQDTGNIFYSDVCRTTLLELIPFIGTEAEKQAFIANGNTANQDVLSFIEKNQGLMVALMPYTRGITNAGSVETLCDGGFETITQTPQWMLDLGLPARQSGYDLIPKFAENDDYVKVAQRPVRFWCAVDDAQTSTYGNYAIYRYLLNGGSDAEFTFITIGTGGHNAMDISPLAEKTSGTTSLGIAYTNVPVAYVQVAEYFHRFM